MRDAELWPDSRAGAVLTVDLSAIAANYRALRDRAAGAVCAAVVKADAYGLGAEQVAPVLERAGARVFFVAHVDEGIALRRFVSPEAVIYVLHGFRPGAAADCAAFGLRPVLNTPGQVASWRKEAARRGVALEAALQLDSGMSRFGLSSGEARALAGDPSALEGVSLTLVMSHLACADEPANPANRMQLRRFLEGAAFFPGVPRSLAASSGIFLGPDWQLDLVRPGAALYGIAPDHEGANPLRPVVRLSARIVQLRDVAAGEGVGYGLTWRAASPSRIATVSVGYADGFLRSAGGKGFAWLGAQKLPIVGRISMDSLAVDVSDVPRDSLGEDGLLDLIGPEWGVDDAARAAGTIGYEILTSLGPRYHRVYTVDSMT